MFFRSISAVAGSQGRPPIPPAPRRAGRDCGEVLLRLLVGLGALALLAAIALYTAKPFVALLGSAVAAPPVIAGSEPQSSGKTVGYDGQTPLGADLPAPPVSIGAAEAQHLKLRGSL